MLSDLGADFNLRLFQDERGWTPLCDAIMDATSVNNGNREPYTANVTSCPPLDMIQLLLDRGADPNANQAGEETVLHRAIG